MSLFSQIPDEGTLKTRARSAPLAERMRPRTLEDYVGQEHLLGPGKPLRVEIERDDPGSMILWGPPGVGKTTLAKIIAEATQASFIEFSAVMGGMKEIKQVMVDAEKAAGFGSRTILFIDEIHRFNKAQQDAFLPYVERGTIRLIGATTENPSFEVIAALLSRCRVYRLTPLTDEQLTQLLKRALTDKERGLGGVTADDDAVEMIAGYASGDARYAYNALETAAKLAAGGRITREIVQNALQQRVLLYDKQGEEHYNLISALHKSIRNSDADASLYWLGRMLKAGEDPMYVARRLVRMAVEDVGLAAPEALRMALAARDAIDFLGSPEGDLALAQAAVYLALAPKSNALYTAYGEITAEIEAHRAEPVPLHLRNAPTPLMEQFGYGEGYQYAHDLEGRVADMECMPENLRGREFYHPTAEGREKLLAQRMDEVRRIRAAKRAGRKPEPKGSSMDQQADPQWLSWTKRLQAIAQTGLTFTRDHYDHERYEELQAIAAEMMAVGSGIPDSQKVLDLFRGERGYATPKVEVRGAVVREDQILLVREREDGGWTLPGGWADVGESPSAMVVREVKEESGYEVVPRKLAAVFDRNKHPHPPEPTHAYKLYSCASCSAARPRRALKRRR